MNMARHPLVGDLTVAFNVMEFPSEGYCARLDHLPTQQEVLAIADKWRPYRSLATSYLFTATFAQAKTPPPAPRKT
jgi:hypothetical protein